MQKARLLVTMILLFAEMLPAQTGRQYAFTHYTISSGLVSNQINSVVQDEDGYLWIASNEGLQRYDASRFKTFLHKKNDTTSLPNNIILQLLRDKKNNIWVVTSEFHVGIFDTKTFKFREAAIHPSDPNGPPTTKKLSTDEFGNVFLHLIGLEVLVWDEKRHVFTNMNKALDIPQEVHVIDFAHQPGTTKYYLGLYPTGLGIYDAKTRTLSYPGKNAGNEPLVEEVSKFGAVSGFMFDKKNRLWFVGWGPGFPYAFCYDLGEKKVLLKKEFISTLRSYYEIYGFFEQKDGTIWTRGMGIFAQFLEKEKDFQIVHNGYLNERSIHYDAIFGLYEDRENNIWVATKNNGLYRFNPSEEYFRNTGHINRLNNSTGSGSVMAFMPTRWGSLLVATWGDGIYSYDNNLDLIPTNIRGIDNNLGPIVWSMSYSNDSNTLWLSAQPGLYAVDQRTRIAKFYNPPILENRTIRQLAEDKLGNLWLGMQRVGLYKWSASKGKNDFHDGIEKFTKVPVTQINKVILDRKGLVWVATEDQGLYVINPVNDSIVYQFSSANRGPRYVPGNGISSVLEYDDSLMVISTANSIHLFNRIRNTLITIGSEDLLSTFIASIERDKNGYLWVSTTSGIFRVNIHRNIFVRFTKKDGIDNDNFILAASRTLPDGTMLFGSSNQFLSFDPSKINLNKKDHEVLITDFRVMNRTLQVDSLLRLKEIELPYDKNSIAIEFSSLSFLSEYPVMYMMEGLDKDWIAADKTNQGIYSYLPPGSYTFLVKSLDAEGNEGGKITRLPIVVSPPFWQTWWFYSIMVLAGIAILFWIDRERMQRKEAFLNMRSTIAGNLHREINTALNNINILSEMARIKADRDIEKSKEYIEQIHARSHNMIIAMDDMLWSIDPANDSMQKTIERMKEYIAALNSRNDANIEMIVDKKVESLSLNMRLRHESFILFKDGIKNLVDAGAKNCNVHIGLEKSQLQFTIQFDNYCCNMQQINNVLHSRENEKRMRAMDAEMKVQIHKSNSVIFLEFPLN